MSNGDQRRFSASDTRGAQLPLFSSERTQRSITPLGDGACVLHGFALSRASVLQREVERVSSTAPFRNMMTPSGFRMSVAMTNCGQVGWVSDQRGYRYSPCDPETQTPWPAMPHAFLALATEAAEAAHFAAFSPDACLINRYEPSARMSLHQDKDELDLDAPIVSVSLGLPATFLFGGPRRNDRAQRVRLEHGDVVVWGGPSRLFYHGVLALKPGTHSELGAQRINLTFRKTR